MKIAILSISVCLLAGANFSRAAEADPCLKGAYRRPAQNGWIFVHLQGSPHCIGFEHGYLLAPEIEDAEKVVVLEQTVSGRKDWDFFRNAARQTLWPHIESEYQEELKGIAAGLAARGIGLDLWDVVALNAFCEWTYYVREYDLRLRKHRVVPMSVPERCSAFVATGKYTRDGKVIMAHTIWTNYLDGARWTIVFDIAPEHGHRILMDGFPGVIHSADDFGINSAGMMITETTISRFFGYDPNGIPEFVRARKAMQYSSSIDDFARLMKEGNNGGYANTWLVADRKNNEIASLELGLKNVTLQRSFDGYFVGSNFPSNPKLIREETNFDPNDSGESANARHARWDQLMAQYEGKIDVEAAKRFLSDHYDVIEKKIDPDERTLCGHFDLSPRGTTGWQPPYGTGGSAQNKITDSAMAAKLSFTAAAGHACGMNFKAAEHLRAHRQFLWEEPFLKDVPAQPWTTFSATQ
jgi:hypothetical protein